MLADTDVTVVWPEFERTAITVAPTIGGCKSLALQALTALVDGVTDSQGFDPSAFDHVKQLLSFQADLQQVLKERQLDHIPASILAHLIAMAFEGHTRLTLTRFKGLSTEAVVLCLQKTELRTVRSVALCLQTMKLPLDGIEQIITAPGAVKEVFVIDHPDPTAADKSDDVELPHLRAVVNKLLLAADCLPQPRPRLHFSSTYLDALHKTQWYALPTYQAASSLTPSRVRHILVGVQDPMGRFDYYQIDNVLLDPETMVTRLLHWLRTDDEHHFCGFSCGPLSLSEELSHRIGPVPVVRHFGYEHEQRIFRQALHEGESEGWILHVRKMKFPGTGSWGRCDGTRVAYGFLRWHPENKGVVLQIMTAQEYLNVSCADFIRDELLIRRLHEAAEAIRNWGFQPDSCPDGTHWLMDMKALDGCSPEVFLASYIGIVE